MFVKCGTFLSEGNDSLVEERRAGILKWIPKEREREKKGCFCHGHWKKKKKKQI